MTGFRNRVAQDGDRRRIARAAVVVFAFAFVFAFPHPARLSSQPVAPMPAIAVDDLGSIDAGAIGTLTEATGGFGADLWNGTPRSVVDRYWPRLPIGAPSAGMRVLAERLMLTAAPPPAASPDDAPAFLVQRARHLLDAGRIADVVALTDRVPAAANVPGLARVATEARFLAGESDSACGLVAGSVATVEDAFWPRALAVCQALAGDHEKAALGVAVLEESGTIDPALAALVARMAGEDRTVEPASTPTPLHVVLARAMALPVPAAADALRQPWLAGAIATAPHEPPLRRLVAAERAHATGVLTAAQMQNFYATIRAAPAATSTQEEKDAAARAEHYRKTVAESSPTSRTRLAVDSLADARSHGRYAAAADVLAGLLSDLEPADAPFDAAPDVVAALLVAGARDTAAAWLAHVESEAGTNSAARMVWIRLVPLSLLATLAAPANADEMLSLWWERTGSETDTDGRAALAAGLLQALGEPVPRVLRAAAAPSLATAATSTAGPALAARIAEAAEAGRTGKTVLLSLVALGDGGPAATDPETLAAVVKALGRIGQEDSARRFAVEAAAARGL